MGIEHHINYASIIKNMSDLIDIHERKGCRGDRRTAEISHWLYSEFLKVYIR